MVICEGYKSCNIKCLHAFEHLYNNIFCDISCDCNNNGIYTCRDYKEVSRLERLKKLEKLETINRGYLKV